MDFKKIMFKCKMLSYHYRQRIPGRLPTHLIMIELKNVLVVDDKTTCLRKVLRTSISFVMFTTYIQE